MSVAQSCEAFAARLHLEREQPVPAAGPCLELTAASHYTSQPARAAAPLKRTTRPQQRSPGQPHMRHNAAPSRGPAAMTGDMAPTVSGPGHGRSDSGSSGSVNSNNTASPPP